MTWWAWTVVGLACWVLVCLVLVVAWIATIEWHRRKRDPKPPAAEETGAAPGSPRRHPPAPPPLPGPRKLLDIRVVLPNELDVRLAWWDCGCHLIRNNLTGKQDDLFCERHAFAAEWNPRLHQ